MIKKFQDLVFSIIDDDLNIARKNIEIELKRIVNFPLNWVVNSESLDLTKVYFPAPTMGTAIDQRFCIYEPLLNKGKTIFFPNFPDGWDSLVYGYSKKYNCQTFSISISDPSREYPRSRFQVNYGSSERIVYAMKDSDKWVFFQTGKVQPYENIKYYDNRRIKDRLNENIINEYLKKVGWDLNDPLMWQSEKPAIYYQRLQWDRKGN